MVNQMVLVRLSHVWSANSNAICNNLPKLERHLQLIYLQKTFISALSYYALGKLLAKNERIVRGFSPRQI